MTICVQPVETNTAPSADRAYYDDHGTIGRWLRYVIDDDHSVIVKGANINSLLHPLTYIDGTNCYRSSARVKYALFNSTDNFTFQSGFKVATRCSTHDVGVVHKYKTSGWSGKIDKIVTELGRLKSDWDGNGAVSPSPALINQLERALHTLPHETKEPEVEVDPSDGSVVIRWWSADGEAAFSMTFVGNDKLYAVMSSSGDASTSWQCSVRDETKIIDNIENLLIRKVLVSNA